MRIELHGVRDLLANFDVIRRRNKAAQAAAIAAGGAVFLAQVKKYGGIKDGHSLKVLADLGHPYARSKRAPNSTRAGAGSRTRIQRGSLGHADWWVHNQTGRLLAAIKGKQSPGKYAVYVDTGQAYHAKYVIMGTRVMFPRDFIWMTANQRKTRKLIMREVARVYGKKMRTKAGLRFSVGGSGK